MVIIVPIVAIAAVSCLMMARTFARREPRQVQPDRIAPTEFDARLERVVQAVDVIAGELERISENQRALSKVLAERKPSESRLGSG